MEATVDRTVVLVGSRRLLEERGFDLSRFASSGPEAEVWVAHPTLIGVVYLRDRVRDATPDVIAQLKEMGSSVALISGDREAVAERVARAAGIEEVHADLTPNDKLKWIDRWREEGRKVAMVGDGINDAPSLIAADVGLGMGARCSDAALAQADVILMHDWIENVPAALRLSRQARRIIRQNLVVSLGTVAVLVACALSQVITLSLGVVGHEGSTVVVVLNGLRLLRLKPARNI